jgi:hypothetical protein
MFSTQPIFADLTPPDTNTLNLNTFPLFSSDSSPSNQNVQGSNTSNHLESQWAWDMVSLGMQEELPPEDLTNKLYLLEFTIF